VLSTLTAFGPLSIDMYLPSLPTIGEELSASVGDVQLTLGAFFIGFAVGQLLYGPLSDRVGRRPVLFAGIGLYVVTSALCALSTDIDQLVLFRFLHALGGGAGTVIARAIVRDRFDTDGASRVLSLMMLVMSVAPLMAPIVGAQILSVFGWRAIFWVLAGFGALCLVLVSIALPETNTPERRTTGPLILMLSGYAAALRHRKALACLACSGFGFGGLFAYISGTPFVYIEVFGVSPDFFGVLFGMNVIGLAVGASANARLVGRLGAVHMLRSGATIMAVSGVALLAAALSGFAGLVGIVIPLFFYVGSISMLGANSISIAAADFPRHAGSVAALFGAVQFGMGAAAGLAVGQLHNDTAVPMAGVIAVCGVSVLLASLLIRRA